MIEIRAVDFAFSGTKATVEEVDALKNLVEKLTGEFLPCQIKPTNSLP